MGRSGMASLVKVPQLNGKGRNGVAFGYDPSFQHKVFTILETPFVPPGDVAVLLANRHLAVLSKVRSVSLIRS